MSNDMPTHRFASISSSEQSTSTWIRLDLVRVEHDNVEFLRDLVESVEEATEFLLPVGKLPTANVVDAEKCHQTVNDEESDVASHELLREFVDCGRLLLTVACTALDNVLVGQLWVHAEAFGNLDDTFWAEGSFGV